MPSKIRPAQRLCGGGRGTDGMRGDIRVMGGGGDGERRHAQHMRHRGDMK
jgi:hypothetical protein